MTGATDVQPSDSKLKTLLTPILGLAVLAGFAAFIVFLLFNLTLSDTSWSRAIYLFGGVEAVAFAAAGYFFGTQVQRSKVEEAKRDSDAAKQVATAATDQAKAERRASRQLAQGIVSRAESSATARPSLLGGESAPLASVEIDAALLAQARALLQD